MHTWTRRSARGATCRPGASPPVSIRRLTCRWNDQWELTLIPVPCLPVSSIGTRRAFLWPVHSTTPSTLDTTRPALWVRSHCGLVTTSTRSEEHTSDLQSLMRTSYAVSCLQKTNIVFTAKQTNPHTYLIHTSQTTTTEL